MNTLFHIIDLYLFTLKNQTFEKQMRNISFKNYDHNYDIHNYYNIIIIFKKLIVIMIVIVEFHSRENDSSFNYTMN